MSEPQARQAGWYWVRLDDSEPWEIAHWCGIEWDCANAFDEIGPRVPSPEELERLLNKASDNPFLFVPEDIAQIEIENTELREKVASIEAATARDCADIAEADMARFPKAAAFRVHAAKRIAKAIRRKYKLNQGAEAAQPAPHPATLG